MDRRGIVVARRNEKRRAASAPARIIPWDFLGLFCCSFCVMEGPRQMLPDEQVASPGFACFICILLDHGSDLAMIRRLTAHTTMASSKDSFCRFPLHWACEGVASTSTNTLTGSSGSSPARRRKQRGTQPARAAAVAADTIHFLLELFPEAMTVKDCGGKTPFDLAMAQQQYHTALSSFLPRRNHQQQQARSITMTRIQLELTTALWKLMPTYRAVVRKQQDKGTRRHARMRFVV
jgi:ankyrin repeat protein